jgi:acyl-CoA reductase-like NAD-dependent aldehyde dehydrogenase
MTAIQKTITPIDGSVYVERPLADSTAIAKALAKARAAQPAWSRVPLAERARICGRAVDAFLARKAAVAEEITWQMGRPLRYTPLEVDRLEERARHMIAIAAESLADVRVAPREGFTRFIRREPLGVVFTIAPWNYPYLTSVNSIVPALMAGNGVLLKHSPQTPLCAERYAEAFAEAGLPEGVFQYLHLSDADTARLVTAPEVDFVSFTGSVRVGRAVEQAAAGRFIGLGLELGGKDPAYVRADAKLDDAVENLVDGSYFNSGQSCCAVERIYVHASLFKPFVEAFVALTRQYRLGDPRDPETTLGPMVRTAAAQLVREHIAEAVQMGARALIDPKAFPAQRDGTPYLAPQVLVDVNHSMRVMREETFGPVVGILSVASDEEAVRLMNDSPYGLTASIWTRDAEAAVRLGGQVRTGTCFMNRCDYLDPALAWTGVKDSGRGCSLSALGYEQLTRPKSYHLRTAI